MLKALRWTYLGSGITHPNFLATVGKLGPGLREKLKAVAPAFCQEEAAGLVESTSGSPVATSIGTGYSRRRP